MTKFLRCFPLIILGVLAGCGGGSVPTSNDSHASVVLQSIQVSAGSAPLVAGLTGQLTATGSYSDGSTKDLTTSATWSSSNPAVATIAGNGVAKGMAPGSCVVTATQASLNGTARLTIVPPVLVSIAVSSASPSVAAGSTDQFTATGTYSDGSNQILGNSVTWSTSNSAMASISSSGVATGTSHGSVVITAKSGTVSGTANLTVTSLVSIAITMPLSAIEIGTTEQLRATGTFSDGSTQDVTSVVNWASSDITKATISNSIPTNGLVHALKAGSSIITATSGGISAASTLTVNGGTLTSLVVTSPATTIPLKVVQQITATGTFSDGKTQDITNTVSWSSSQSAVASITVSGAVTALSVGTTTITATSGAVSGSIQLTVDATNLVSITIQQGNVTIAQSTSKKLNAIGLFNDGSTRDISYQATWTSSTPGVATVQAGGWTHGVTPGSSTITATLGAQSVSATLTVSNATIVSVSVTPTISSIAAGTRISFTATGQFSDSSTQLITNNVTWASSDTTVATISNGSGSQGAATAVATGPVTINATFGTVVGSAQLNVSAANLTSITLTPASAILAPASALQYSAIGNFDDGSTQNLNLVATWSTSSPTTATVTSYGQATGQSAGLATITASMGGVSSTANVVVESTALTSITVLPANLTIPQEISTNLTALGTFADGSTQNLTSAVTWTSSSPSVAIVSNTPGTSGQVTGVGPGSSTIAALFAGQVGSATLQVTNATLTALAILPNSPSIALGASEEFVAKGTFSDGTILEVSSQVVWTSSNVNVAVINAQGLASSASSGTTTITASLNGVNTTAVLTVQ